MISLRTVLVFFACTAYQGSSVSTAQINDEGTVIQFEAKAVEFNIVRKGVCRILPSENVVATTTLHTRADELKDRITLFAPIAGYNLSRIAKLSIPDIYKAKARSAVGISLSISDPKEVGDTVTFRVKVDYILNKGGTHRVITPDYAKGELWEFTISTGNLKLIEPLDSWGILEL